MPLKKNKQKKTDEVEYLITARSWDYLKGFLGVFATCEEDFVSLIDGMYPTEKPADVSARDSMQVGTYSAVQHSAQRETGGVRDKGEGRSQ